MGSSAHNGYTTPAQPNMYGFLPLLSECHLPGWHDLLFMRTRVSKPSFEIIRNGATIQSWFKGNNLQNDEEANRQRRHPNSYWAIKKHHEAKMEQIKAPCCRCVPGVCLYIACCSRSNHRSNCLNKRNALSESSPRSRLSNGSRIRGHKDNTSPE